MATERGRGAATVAAHAALVAALFAAPFAPAAAAPPEPVPAPSGSAQESPAFPLLVGSWTRLDGGYRVDIRGVGPDGRLEASYANPKVLPFAVARAKKDRGALLVYLELRAGGYDGSTYNLAYDPGTDTLGGEYYQAVARERYPVRFVRDRSPRAAGR